MRGKCTFSRSAATSDESDLDNKQFSNRSRYSDSDEFSNGSRYDSDEAAGKGCFLKFAPLDACNVYAICESLTDCMTEFYYCTLYRYAR